jgi:hypothetical protein
MRAEFSLLIAASLLYSIGGYSLFQRGEIFLIIAIVTILSISILSFNYKYTKNSNNIEISNNFIYILFILILLYYVVVTILPLEFWLLPGAIKYKSFTDRSGFLYAFVIALIPYLLSRVQSKPWFYIATALSSITVLLSLGRNPSLIYFILLFLKFNLSLKKSLVLSLFGVFSAIFVDIIRAKGFEMGTFDFFLSMDLLDYFKNSGEATVFGRIYEVYYQTNGDISFISLQSFINPWLSLIPKYFNGFEEVQLARLISDNYHTTGGLPLAIEGMLYGGYIGILLFYILAFIPILALFLKAKIVNSFFKRVFLIFLIINSFRIDMTTLYGFAFNGFFLIFVYKLIEILPRLVKVSPNRWTENR